MRLCGWWIDTIQQVIGGPNPYALDLQRAVLSGAAAKRIRGRVGRDRVGAEELLSLIPLVTPVAAGDRRRRERQGGYRGRGRNRGRLCLPFTQ